MTVLTATLFAISSLVLLGALLWPTVAELQATAKRGGEALYLVSRVGLRHGYRVQEKPLSIHLGEDASDSGAPVLHYFLLTPLNQRDSITLRAERPASSPVGDVVIDNDPVRFVVPGLSRVGIGVPHFDRRFRVFAAPEQHERLRTRLAMNRPLLERIRDLACRSRRGRFELVDLGGQLKIQFDDRALRFPSDVEQITLDLVHLYELYRHMLGGAQPSSRKDTRPRSGPVAA